jgi:hypothetical protein
VQLPQHGAQDGRIAGRCARCVRVEAVVHQCGDGSTLAGAVRVERAADKRIGEAVAQAVAPIAAARDAGTEPDGRRAVAAEPVVGATWKVGDRRAGVGK